MDYLRITDWEKTQHYKKRNPPWVKLYNELLDDDRFECLQDDSKLLYLCLLMFASRKENKVKLDCRWLQKKLPISKAISLTKTIQPLTEAGLIEVYQDDSTPIAGGKQDAMLRREEKRQRRDREETETECRILFEKFRLIYPGSKNGLDPEWENFTKKHKDWRDKLPLLEAAVERQIATRNKAKEGQFVPDWKMLSTWINKSCWTQEQAKDSDGRDCIICGAPYAEGHKYQMNQGRKEYKCAQCRGVGGNIKIG